MDFDITFIRNENIKIYCVSSNKQSIIDKSKYYFCKSDIIVLNAFVH